LTASHVTTTQVIALLVLKVLGAKGLLGHPLPRKLPMAADNQIVYMLFKNGLRRGIDGWFCSGHWEA